MKTVVLPALLSVLAIQAPTPVETLLGCYYFYAK
jgi:hypothetical protein